MKLFAPRPALATAARVPSLARGDGTRVVEFVVLLVAGVAAAATHLIDLGVRVPGHAILLAVFPFSLGFALVPRRLAGTVMSTSALAATLALNPGSGSGATASLAATGVVLDFAVARAKTGRGVYVALVLGGLAANAFAFAVRLATRLVFHDANRPFADWWPRAIVGYTVCGAAAGLVGAVVWFRFRERRA